jgi:hypothetical protein
MIFSRSEGHISIERSNSEIDLTPRLIMCCHLVYPARNVSSIRWRPSLPSHARAAHRVGWSSRTPMAPTRRRALTTPPTFIPRNHKRRGLGPSRPPPPPGELQWAAGTPISNCRSLWIGIEKQRCRRIHGHRKQRSTAQYIQFNQFARRGKEIGNQCRLQRFWLIHETIIYFLQGRSNGSVL